MKCTLVGNRLIIDGASHQVTSVKNLPPDLRGINQIRFWGTIILGSFIIAKPVGKQKSVIFELKTPLKSSA